MSNHTKPAHNIRQARGLDLDLFFKIKSIIVYHMAT